MAEQRLKQIHLVLRDEQIDDLEAVRKLTGITNDNDLVRYLLRRKARELRERAQLVEGKERA